jgi:tungstate transport system substrate-binding protein
MKFTYLALKTVVAVWLATAAVAENFTLAVTTWFHNSGLSDVLVPQIKMDTGLDVNRLVVGTGQLIALGKVGDVDAILVHARAAEGYRTHRREITFNDFVVIGLKADPAEVQFANTVGQCFGALSDAPALFVGRGDDSEPHQRGDAIWKKAGVTPDPAWWRELGFGMGATLNTAAAMGAYTLSERASWLSFGNKDGMTILFSRDFALQNQYTHLAVDPASHPHVAYKAAVTLENCLTSQKGQSLIGGYTIDGETLFTPNAKVR